MYIDIMLLVSSSFIITKFSRFYSPILIVDMQFESACRYSDIGLILYSLSESNEIRGEYMYLLKEEEVEEEEKLLLSLCVLTCLQSLVYLFIYLFIYV